MSNNKWNEWIFRILGWVNPGSRIEGKNPFFVSSKKFCLKDNNKTENWVGNSKIKHSMFRGGYLKYILMK